MSAPELKPTLESARLKLERSLELLDQLHGEINKSSEEIRHRGIPAVTTRIAAEGDWIVAYADEIREHPPLRWGSLAGEAMHAARSALDHLACRLVELERNAPTTSTAFPIWRAEPFSRDARRSFNKSIEGMSDEHKESIRRLQPYANAGTKEAEMLLALSGLDNTDKHRILIPQQQALSKESLGGKASSPTVVLWNTQVAIVPGSEIFRYRKPNHDLKVEVRVVCRVAFGEDGIGLSQLYDIRTYCVGIVESFGLTFQ